MSKGQAIYENFRKTGMDSALEIDKDVDTQINKVIGACTPERIIRI